LLFTVPSSIMAAIRQKIIFFIIVVFFVAFLVALHPSRPRRPSSDLSHWHFVGPRCKDSGKSVCRLWQIPKSTADFP
ncbi:MAG: hypothetical protein PUJ13_00150, partial [Bacteroidales bacterium]|nr:hypothetical protein [Bacteroidales bacterium]